MPGPAQKLLKAQALPSSCCLRCTFQCFVPYKAKQNLNSTRGTIPGDATTVGGPGPPSFVPVVFTGAAEREGPEELQSSLLLTSFTVPKDEKYIYCWVL